MSVPLAVTCPCCRAALSVDPATGAAAVAAAPPKPDMAAALKALSAGKERREDAFRQSLSAEQTKGERLGKAFEEGVRRARENPGETPPPREVDL